MGRKARERQNEGTEEWADQQRGSLALLHDRQGIKFWSLTEWLFGWALWLIIDLWLQQERSSTICSWLPALSPRQKHYSYFKALEHTSLIIFIFGCNMSYVLHEVRMLTSRFLFFIHRFSLRSISSIAQMVLEQKYIFNSTPLHTVKTFCKTTIHFPFCTLARWIYN